MGQQSMQIVRQDEQLLAAAYGGKLTEFQRLVEQEEVGVNSKNEFGVSALHMAVMSGSLHVAAYMLSRSVNVNAQDDEGQTALHQACIDGDSDAFGLLTAHKADVGARTRVGKTPLHLACWFDHEEIVSFLLEAGADVHAQDNDGKCVLDDEEMDPDIRQLITEHSTVVRKPRVINLEKKTTTTSSMGCCVTEDELVNSEEQGSAAENDCQMRASRPALQSLLGQHPNGLRHPRVKVPQASLFHPLPRLHSVPIQRQAHLQVLQLLQ